MIRDNEYRHNTPYKPLITREPITRFSTPERMFPSRQPASGDTQRSNTTVTVIVRR